MYLQEYVNCRLCPRNCAVDRNEKSGFCKMPVDMYIGRASLHMWEEPCISGTRGSGTIFFAGCNLKCVYCQNIDISDIDFMQQRKCQADGNYIKISEHVTLRKVSVEELSDIMLLLQLRGANNINLVTPSHYAVSIRQAIMEAKNKGLTIPVVYNTSGYENTETLKMLEGLIDIYLTDFKYLDNNRAKRYSMAFDYVDVAKAAVDEMVRQVGISLFDEEGMMKRGVIVRHLMLPGGFEDSKAVVDYLYEKYGDLVYISVMNQYTPMENCEAYPEINKRVSKRVYEHMLRYIINKGITNCYVQEDGTDKMSFIPEFNGNIIDKIV